jgi:hypothetical protein
MENGKSKTVEDLRTMADALKDLQLNLEPVRDKALDQKAYFTGYAACAEQMIKVIVAKMEHLQNQARLKENGDLVEENVVPEEEPKESEAPLIVEPEEPKPKTRRKSSKKTREVKEN